MTHDEPGLLAREDALALIEGIERAARRSRPFFVYGLLAVLIGFIVATVYLISFTNSLREAKDAAEQRTAELSAKSDRLTASLNDAGRLAKALPESPAKLALITRLREARGDAASLEDAVVATAPEPATAGAPPPATATREPVAANAATTANPAAVAGPPENVRLFIHIVSEDQRPAALEFGLLLRNAQLGGSRITIPEIQLVGSGNDSLRCHKPRDCAWADELARLINQHLRGRSVHAIDLTRRNFPGVRPGTYELWFAPGPIGLPPPS